MSLAARAFISNSNVPRSAKRSLVQFLKRGFSKAKNKSRQYIKADT